MRTLLVAPLLVLTLLTSLPAQEAERNARMQDELAEMKAVILKLQKENKELRAKLETTEGRADAESYAATKAAEREAMEEKLRAMDAQKQQQDMLLKRAAQRQAELAKKEEYVKKARIEEIKRLEIELQRLVERESAFQDQAKSISAAPDAIQAMARRMAEAQVENRLNTLHAEALVTVFEERLEEEEKRSNEEAELAIRKAELLIDRRKGELELVATQMRRGGLSDIDRNALAIKLRQAESELAEAELIRQEAALRRQDHQREANERLAEAALELAVNRAVERGLQEEMLRIKDLLAEGSNMEQLRKQQEVLQKQLLDVRAAAAAEARAMEAAKFEREREMESKYIFPLQLKLEELQRKYGQEHPSTKAIEMQIEAVSRYLDDLKAAENRKQVQEK